MHKKGKWLVDICYRYAKNRMWSAKYRKWSAKACKWLMRYLKWSAKAGKQLDGVEMWVNDYNMGMGKERKRVGDLRKRLKKNRIAKFHLMQGK